MTRTPAGRRGAAIAVGLAMAASAVVAKPASAASCETLAAMMLPNAKVTLAQTVEAGKFVVPGNGEGNAALKGLPAFCRLTLTLTPSSDSDIKMELWLPAANWNGKLQTVGNGGWAGSISYGAMGEALNRGYATSSTDTGHVGDTASGLLGHPEKLTDFAYRAVHEVTLKSKSIIDAFYGSPAKYSYFNGCSGGGRQALKEAQFYPGDYNGIIAGAPNLDAIRGSAGRMWVALATHKDEQSFIPPSKYPVVHQAVLNACDALDGVKDGVLENPRACTFDPAVLACTGEDGPSCLTKPQVAAAKQILSPVTDPRTGKQIFPAVEPGAELGWGQQAGGTEVYRTSMEAFKYVVYKDPNWDWRTFDVNKDLALIDNFTSAVQATDTNLKPFASAGGKLLMYHGWADQSISPGQTVNYYASVVKGMGGAEKNANWIRLFMVPGMFHCGGGDGTSSFDMVSALEQWVEKGKTPASIPAARVKNGVTDRTRPLCAYPQVAAYKGSGSTDEAANFVCKAQ